MSSTSFVSCTISAQGDDVLWPGGQSSPASCSASLLLVPVHTMGDSCILQFLRIQVTSCQRSKHDDRFITWVPPIASHAGPVVVPHPLAPEGWLPHQASLSQRMQKIAEDIHTAVSCFLATRWHLTRRCLLLTPKVRIMPLHDTHHPERSGSRRCTAYKVLIRSQLKVHLPGKCPALHLPQSRLRVLSCVADRTVVVELNAATAGGA